MVEFDIDEIPSQLVLNGLPSDGNRMFVNFSYSRFFLDTNTGRSASDFSMRLDVIRQSGTTSYSYDSVSRCNYFFPYTPVAGDSLNINIKVGENTLSAGTKIPKPLQTDNFQTINTWEVGSSSGAFDTVLNLCIIGLELTDDPNDDNFYYIHIDERDSGSRFNEFKKDFDTIDTIYHNVMFMCQSPTLTSPDALLSSPLLVLPQGYTVYDHIICNDKQMNGSKRSIGVILPILVDTNEVFDETHVFKHDYIFHIESIRPERVRYLLDVATATSMTSMFAEPAGTYSNVIINGMQGLGLFSGISHQKFPFSIDPWPYPENLNKHSIRCECPELIPFLRQAHNLKYQQYR